MNSNPTIRFNLVVLIVLILNFITWAGKMDTAAYRADDIPDPYLWLENVTGDSALTWVKAKNAESKKTLSESPEFDKMKSGFLSILNSKERIPYITKKGALYYNFWRDEAHSKGIWRRTTFAEYQKAEPKWELLLDLDSLSKFENTSWVWHGAHLLKPECTRALVSLSRGGADATVVREFDLSTKAFVKGGFELPEAKGGLDWIDRDHVFVSTDFGAGSLTESGYPRIAKLWTRGTPLAEAELVFEGKATDVQVAASHDDTKGFERDFVVRDISFFHTETYYRKSDGTLFKLDIPDDSKFDVFREWMTVQLRTAWTVGGKTFPPGALLVTRFEDFLKGGRAFEMIFEPTKHRSLEGFSWTRHHLFLNVLDDVKNSLLILTPGEKGWQSAPFEGAPSFCSISVNGVDPEESDDYFLNITGFLVPSSLWFGSVGGAPKKIKSLPDFFDASKLEVSQHFVKSKDGTEIPYFQVSPKGMKSNGTCPTYLTGYGGFEISYTPYYSAIMGSGWMTGGNTFVLANIRGGGEYGPEWHESAIKENRMRCYEDFSAVAKDLIRRKVTSPAHLGVEGGSNGGLLVGNMLTQYPELFGAVVCRAPLLDMKRYSHLLAGASWMSEYGDPDKPEEWQYIQKFSPYHNLSKTVKYPPILFTTSTRDDRVYPGHARKMAAKMVEMGKDVLFYENIEGGHGGAADNDQIAFMEALCLRFLQLRLR